MSDCFGKLKIHRLSKAWTEASVIWAGNLKFEGEDELMVINFFIVWRHMPVIVDDRDPLIWSHISKNLDDVIKKFLMIDTNCFALKNVHYFSTCLIMIVMDRIWQSNINVTILRRFRPVLAKAAKDIEQHFRGGFRNDFSFVIFIFSFQSFNFSFQCKWIIKQSHRLL